MKILVLSRLFHPHIGGVEKHVYEISMRLIAQGHQVTVVTEHFDKSLDRREVFEGITVYRIPINFGKKTKYQVWVWLLKHLNLLFSSDIVHCHDVFFWYLPFRFLFPQKKVYTTFHGHEGGSKPTQKAVQIRRLSNSLSHGSINIGEYIEKWYGTTSRFVSYGATDLVSEFQTKHLVKKPYKILFLGRIAEDNAVELYAQVLEQLRGEKFPFTFEALGDGSSRTLFEPYGTLHGFQEDLGPYIKSADVVFAASYLSILTSLSYKKFVISAYQNQLKKDYLILAPFAKWLVISDDVKNIKQSIKEYLRDSNHRNQIQDDAREYAQKQTWDSLTNLYLRLWSI